MMKTSTHLAHQQRLRKVAILVATLDTPLAEKLLAGFPQRVAVEVRDVVDQLDDIDPVEQRTVVAEFQRGIAAPAPLPAQPPRAQLDGVELDASLLARMAAKEGGITPPAPDRHASHWQALSEADAATLVEMLSAEQPQTIAVVLSRLETSRAAELVGKLAPTLQTEVLSRLAELDPADEQTLDVVASQLAEWITAQRRRRQRMAAGRDLVQRILHDTPIDQRAVLLERLDKRNPVLTEELTTPDVARPVNQSRMRPQASTRVPPATATPTAAIPRQVAGESIDPLSELEALDEQALLRALRLADRSTVMLALAGASEGLMKRVVRGLSRRQARQFRQQLRAIGPTRLTDMLAAQRELVAHARATNLA